MKKPIKAHIFQNRLNETLRVPELGLEVRSKCTSGAMCRKIMGEFPEHEDNSMEVYRGGNLAFTVLNIGRMAKKVIVEDNKGIRMEKYREFNRDWAVSV